MSFSLVQACGSSVRVLCVLYKQTLVRKLTPLVVCIFPTYIPLPNALIDIAKMPSLFHMVLGIPYAAWESVKYEFRATFICVAVTLTCLYIVMMMIWTYYMACTVLPGSVAHGLSDNSAERRLGPGSTLWWRDRRQRVASAAYMRLAMDEKLPVHYDSVTPKIRRACVDSLDDRSSGDAEHDLRCSFRFCKKCPPVPLATALSRLPPELRLEEKLNRRKEALSRKQMAATSAPEAMHYDHEQLEPPPELFHDQDDEGEHDIRLWLGQKQADMIVFPPKPERAHHCRTCGTCILKFDHHCPWINQCVGLGNERYFILFMLWFSFGTLIFSVAGWRIAWEGFTRSKEWSSFLVHRLLYLAIYAKAAVMGMVVFILAIWHLYLAARNETSLENQDNTHYAKMAKERKAVFCNVYDLGWVRNLQLFFNVGPGLAHDYCSLFLPIHIEPYSDGWHWAKRAGLEGRHGGIMNEEEFTDDEGDT